MSRRLKPFQPLAGAQSEASDPLAHAALSASAGTGKTHVLTARVLRLLLRGTAPGAILCLTFTKAGAAEMANRIGERLAHWARLPDDRLRRELAALGEEDGPPALIRARRLFARVLEAGAGGLRIQTIHSFAQSLLASFPAEAGISSGLRPIEGRAESELARRSLADLLERAEAERNDGLAADVAKLSLRLGEAGAAAYLMACARAHEAIAALGAPETIEPLLLRLIGIDDGDAETAVERRLADPEIDLLRLDRLAAANRRWGTATGDRIANNLLAFLAAPPGERARLLGGIGAGLVTAKGEPCKPKQKQVDADPDYGALAEAFATWLVELRTMVAAANLARIQAAGLRAGQAFAASYVRAKRAAGVADFDDLIAWTRRLFSQAGMGEWVRYKLDQRTDHILVDEAQDTNADQWAIVEALVGEFFSGNPEAEDRWRTLFMVGDYKQAIFGFQGTDPREYETFRASVALRARQSIEAAGGAADSVREFRDLSIDASFRSAPAVLQMVDALIGEVGHDALGLPSPPHVHQPHHADRPGRVELWPAFDAAAGRDDEGEEGWIDETTRHYADALAGQVRGWLDAGPMVATTGRTLAPGDILILVRSRSELASLIVARLYARGVPVAGIDRLHLHKPLAVKDLLAAIGFAVQPLGDLNLANALVSPLIGWTQEQLFDLAQPRGTGVYLWTEIQRRRDEGGPIGEAHRILSAWLAMADYVTPARYLETILSGPLDGRRKLIGRLGEAARDPIEELLSAALTFEQEENPSLDRFLAWFGQGDVEVKRDPSAPANAVRVMTVHGAKGLEAPFVILADATHDPERVGGTSTIFDLPVPGIGAIPLVRPRKDECAPVFRAIIDDAGRAERQENWRLAYVALTRAAERLVIAGARPRNDVPDGSWHAASARALTRLGAEQRAMEGWGDALVWEGSGQPATTRRPAGRSPQPIAIPAALRRPAPVESRPPRPLAPSQIVADLDAAPPPGPDMREAARRGTLLHTLFERLPSADPAARRALAVGWLERAGVTDAAARREIADAACDVIEDPAFAGLFGEDSLAEAPIAATLADGRVIAGTADRLCIGADLIRVVDFKTGRHVPADAAAIPPAHRAQMLAYAEALQVIFPGRRIEASLLYTSGPRLIRVSG